MAKAKKPTKHAAQQRYEAKKVAEGAHVQFNVKIKTAADLKMLARLRERFPDEKDPGIARLAMRALDKKRN